CVSPSLSSSRSFSIVVLEMSNQRLLRHQPYPEPQFQHCDDPPQPFPRTSRRQQLLDRRPLRPRANNSSLPRRLNPDLSLSRVRQRPRQPPQRPPLLRQHPPRPAPLSQRCHRQRRPCPDVWPHYRPLGRRQPLLSALHSLRPPL